MRGAFGKPMGKCARVNIGQTIMSVRAKEGTEKHVVEAFRRSKMKFPGRQLIIVSRKWGFTKFDKAEFEKKRDDGVLIPDGSHCKIFKEHGPFAKWEERMSQ